MPIDHGNLPADADEEWTAVGGNTPKKTNAQCKQGQSTKKSSQNDPELGENQTTIIATTTPRRNESLHIIRINFKVIPTKAIKNLSVPDSISRIIASIKAADKSARLIATDEHGNEIEFHGGADITKDRGVNQDYVNQFIEQPKINKSNELTGLVILRSEAPFEDIKKNQISKRELNEEPRIFLTANYLNVVTPTAVGFFINTIPRPDKPEVFSKRLERFMEDNNGNIKFQLEHGPIWAPNHRVSVIKLMAAYEDKEAIRSIMEHYDSSPNNDTYVCMTEFGSLADEQKIKVIRCQMEYASNNRSIFITGFKAIYCEMRTGADPDQDPDGLDTVAYWIFNRTTSHGQKMFTRVYSATDGHVELHVQKHNFKEANDWARLATSQVAGQLNDESIAKVFIDPDEAMCAYSIAPDWKPHSLAAKVAALAEPQIVQQQRRRRDTVNMDYAKENTKRAAAAQAKNKRVGATKQRNNNRYMATSKPGPASNVSNAWTAGGTTYTTTPKTTNENPEMVKQSTKGNVEDEDGDKTMTDNSNETPTKTTTTAVSNKTNNYTDVTAQRLGNLERAMEKLATSNQLTNKSMLQLASTQRTTATQVSNLVQAVTKNKEDADEKHAETLEVMNGFNATFGKFQESFKSVGSTLEEMNKKYNKLAKTVDKLDEAHITIPSPARKIQRSYTTPTKTKVATKITHSTELFDSDDEFDTIKNKKVSQPNIHHSSDAEMTGAADEN